MSGVVIAWRELYQTLGGIKGPEFEEIGGPRGEGSGHEMARFLYNTSALLCTIHQPLCGQQDDIYCLFSYSLITLISTHVHLHLYLNSSRSMPPHHGVL